MKTLILSSVALAALGCSAASRLEREAEARTAEGDVPFNQGNYRAAAAVYEQALEGLPTFPRALLQLGMCWERLGRTDLALSLYEQILKASPEAPQAAPARLRREELVKLKSWDPTRGPKPKEILD